MLTVSDVFSSVRTYAVPISFVAASVATVGVAATYLIDPTLYEINIAVSVLLWVVTGLLNVLHQSSDQLFATNPEPRTAPRPQQVASASSASTDDIDDTERDDFATSMVVADLTGSTAAGYLVGGSLTGALVGEALSEEREESHREERDDGVTQCIGANDDHDSDDDNDCDDTQDASDSGYDSSDSSDSSGSDD